ncbi:MAG: hypothetical protein KW806_03170 [Candidatus Yanofskybacteria bacterium]|nr:hypothetical protein [Candidatus Yanofskybacteria bacterium]
MSIGFGLNLGSKTGIVVATGGKDVTTPGVPKITSDKTAEQPLSPGRERELLRYYREMVKEHIGHHQSRFFLNPSMEFLAEVERIFQDAKFSIVLHVNKDDDNSVAFEAIRSSSKRTPRSTH